MRKIYCLLGIFCLFCFSCKRSSVKKDVDSENIIINFEKSRGRIVVPDSLEDLASGGIFYLNSLSSNSFLIHTLDVTCEGCVVQLNGLLNYFREIEERYGLKTLIIASSAYVGEKVKQRFLHYPYPVLYDENESFKWKNRIIRDDVLCSFLVKDCNLLKVGDLKTQESREDFNRILEEVFRK